MAFLGRARKGDWIVLAQELGIEILEEYRILDLRKLITKHERYEEEFVKGMLSGIVSQREERVEMEKLSKVTKSE